MAPQSKLLKKVKKKGSSNARDFSQTIMWNVTVNLHGNQPIFFYPDPECVHGLAEAYTRYDAKNEKPPFCIAQRSYTLNYLGGVKPIRICVNPRGTQPYSNGFAFLYQYNKQYAFYAIHLGEKTWIISTNGTVGWCKYSIWLGYAVARRRYGEEKIAELGAKGEWDEDKELKDLLWENGSGPEDLYHNLAPALPTSPEWSARIKAAIMRVEDEPQAQMDALIFALRGYEHPGFRNFGPIRLEDLTLTTVLPPPRSPSLANSAHVDNLEQDPVAASPRSQDMNAEAMKPLYRGVSPSQASSQFLIFNTHMNLSGAAQPEYAHGSPLNVVDTAQKEQLESEEVDENAQTERLMNDYIDSQLWSGLN